MTPLIVSVPRRYIAVGLLLLACPLAQALDAYRGLWVGQATLDHVNEVSKPLDENNVAIAPDPKVPTPTADQAHLRLILHVNGVGQVSLLKEVAILSRKDPAAQSSLVSSEGDLVLVTDERLYSEFQGQEARRIASAVFDFGDAQATLAVDDVVQRIATAVAASVAGSGVKAGSDTAAVRLAENLAREAAETLADPVVENADAAARFDGLLAGELSPGKVRAIAVAKPPETAPETIAARQKAESIRSESFYGDARGEDLLDELLAAVAAASDDDAKIAAALAVAARYADVDNLYQRFITGHRFGHLVAAAARAAGKAAAAGNAVPADISREVYADDTVDTVRREADDAQINAYSDASATKAVEDVLQAIIDSAEQALADPPVFEEQAVQEAEAAGLAAAQAAERFPLQVSAPGADYTAFIRSPAFQNCVAGAAEQAAVETVSARRQDPFSTPTSLEGVARIAATKALYSVYSMGALARQTELPLVGDFGPGQSDLKGTIYLPASHPINPFRHPKHPDHTVGLNITRQIRLDFDGELGDLPDHSGLGTEQVSGRFSEEIHGLHKPLGPDPVHQPIGLKVEGTFELNRISLIDTLNAQ